MYVALRPTQHTIDIVAALRGKWHGAYALCHCPAHDDRKPSLSIRQGHRGILVHCFAGCEPQDVLREIARLPAGARSYCADVGHRFCQSRGNPRRLWDDGERDCRARWVPNILPDANFRSTSPTSASIPVARSDPSRVHAIYQPCWSHCGRGLELKAVQRIFLDADTARCSVKMLLGKPGRGTWRAGGSARTLALAEGFEDAAAFTKLTGIRCWAALGAERLPLLRLPDDLDHLILAPDYDRAGRLAARKAQAAYRRPGLTIETRYPSPFKDWAAMNERLIERD